MVSDLKIDEIAPNLFISDRPYAHDCERMQKLGIIAIVNLTGLPLDALLQDHFTILTVKIYEELSPEMFDQIFSYIDQYSTKGKVLVHCGSGLARSGAIVTAQILRTHPGWTWQKAYKYVQQKHNIKIPPLLRERLMKYLDQKFGP